MSEQSPQIPTGGVGSELHEWAVELDAQTTQRLNERIERTRSRIHEFVAGLMEVEELSPEAKLELDLSIENIRNYTYALARHQLGPRMSQVFDGDAMNA